MIRFGLCCMFRDQPIRFVTATATSLIRMARAEAMAKLSRLCMKNADALLATLQYCAAHQIGCFRINSRILPVRTHPEAGYQVSDLPDGNEIIERFRQCGIFARENNIRTCFHPDQFVVLNSPRPDVVQKSIAELEYQAEVAEWTEADVINIHGGGAYGDKQKALDDLVRTIETLSPRIRSRLTFENDDKIFTPEDLLPVCRSVNIPLVYDAHHHRCNPDSLSIPQATKAAMSTWDREPLFHISSPLEGWDGPKPERHHDMIDAQDFPKCWRRKTLTVEVEAKAKEVAVAQLQRDLGVFKADSTWYVYLIRCADDSIYTGITNNLQRRLEQHNAGVASRYTRSRLPVELVYSEPQLSHSDALRREIAIKEYSRKQKESLICSAESRHSRLRGNDGNL
jgi:UV DNA damage endonuclease